MMLFSDLEYGDPSEADVVERYGAEKRIIANRATRAVVLVPVDATGLRRHRRVREVPRLLDVAGGQVTSLAVIHIRREVFALAHTVLVRQATDVVSFTLDLVVLTQIESTP